VLLQFRVLATHTHSFLVLRVVAPLTPSRTQL